MWRQLYRSVIYRFGGGSHVARDNGRPRLSFASGSPPFEDAACGLEGASHQAAPRLCLARTWPRLPILSRFEDLRWSTHVAWATKALCSAS
jgi:hypothetical protein